MFFTGAGKGCLLHTGIRYKIHANVILPIRVRQLGRPLARKV